MPNTLSALQPVAFSAAKEVAAEPFGAVAAINANFDDKRVAKGDTVKVPVAPIRAATDFSASNTTSTGDDSTASEIDVQITKSRKVSWHLTGEQIRSLENGTINQDWVGQLLKQGMRTLRNEAEVDCCSAINLGASRATGTAGTTPFASDLSLLTAARKILQDNGAPLADLQFVCNTDAGLNLRNLGVLQNAYQAGSDAERRSGRFLPQMGFNITESAGIALHTAGTGASYLVNNASGYAAGSTTIAVDTGSGTILAADVLSNTQSGRDSNKYVVGTALSAGSLVLNNPGTRKAWSDNDTVAVTASYTPSFAFERNAVVGIMRPPVMPENPTIQQMLVSDLQGMTYLMLQIAQYGQLTWELHLAWGFKAINGEFIALGLG